jgi:GNAT superfamily N-acetyltransferase
MSYNKTTVPTLPAGYTLVDTCAPVDDFYHLRRAAAVLQINKAQIESSIEHTWFGCHITYTDPSAPLASTAASPSVVAMGRVFGGGWYYHVSDMVVLPEHQRRGLGDIIFKRIMREIEDRSVAGQTLVSLLADPPAQKLYARNGFASSMPAVMGMRRLLELPDRENRKGE